MTVQFQSQVSFELPVSLLGVTPDRMADLSAIEIARQTVEIGNQAVELGELFSVSGDAKDQQFEFSGDLTNVNHLGRDMKSGRILIDGDCCDHLGIQMSGGEIVVTGNCGDLTGAEMTGGVIQVHGNVGDSLGANLPGSPVGMNRGTILVAGNAGSYVGRNMRRGTICVAGRCGEYLGWNMLAGTVITEMAGKFVGQNMVRGTIIIGSDCQPGNTFVSGGVHRPAVVPILRRWLKTFEISMATLKTVEYEMYHGDILAGSRGELFVGLS